MSDGAEATPEAASTPSAPWTDGKRYLGLVALVMPTLPFVLPLTNSPPVPAPCPVPFCREAHKGASLSAGPSGLGRELRPGGTGDSDVPQLSVRVPRRAGVPCWSWDRARS